jgi:hypothetical protein
MVADLKEGTVEELMESCLGVVQELKVEYMSYVSNEKPGAVAELIMPTYMLGHLRLMHCQLVVMEGIRQALLTIAERK